jgi:hypothetical protein
MTVPTPAQAACSHKTPEMWVWVDVEVSPYGETEQQLHDVGSKYTFDETEIGRFWCTQCGLVQYYTGLWRRFFEEGIPCSGSDRFYPNGPNGPYVP